MYLSQAPVGLLRFSHNFADDSNAFYDTVPFGGRERPSGVRSRFRAGLHDTFVPVDCSRRKYMFYSLWIDTLLGYRDLRPTTIDA